MDNGVTKKLLWPLFWAFSIGAGNSVFFTFEQIIEKK